MESLDRYIKRLKNSPATFWIGGSALVIALLLWFVVAVDGWYDDKSQRKHWSRLEDKRADPSDPLYDDPLVKQFMTGNRQWLRFVPMGLATSARDYPDRLAATPDEKLVQLERMAKKNSGNTTGPWFYYYLGNIYYAKGDFTKATAMYKECQKLVGKHPGHILIGHFDFLGSDMKLVEQQESWTKTFAKREAERPVGENPKVELLVDQGKIELELFHQESPVLVKRFCELVASGYYDGLEFYDVSQPGRGGGGRVLAGCPYGNGKGELVADGLRSKIIDRAHRKGTVSMALAEGKEDRSSANRFFMVLSDSTQGASGFDNKNSVIGRVTGGVDLLQKLFKGQKILRARVIEEGDLKGKLDPVDWPGKNQ